MRRRWFWTLLAFAPAPAAAERAVQAAAADTAAADSSAALANDPVRGEIEAADVTFLFVGKQLAT